jgi:hypothetical protein
MADVSIALTRYGKYGWSFSITKAGEFFMNGLPKPSLYRTNESGDGLWKATITNELHEDGSPKLVYEQILEEKNFRMPATERRAYDRIRYQIAKGVLS